VLKIAPGGNGFYNRPKKTTAESTRSAGTAFKIAERCSGAFRLNLNTELQIIRIVDRMVL